jgi:autotransporter translocation and assembly factor TamB
MVLLDSFRATETADQQVEAAGSFNIRTREVSADLEVIGFRLDRFEDVEGIVAMRASVQGTDQKPQVSFQGKAAGLAFQQEPLGDVAFDGSFEGIDLSLNATSDKFSTTVQAALQAEAPYPFNAKVTAADGVVAYRDYSATLNGILQAAGQLQPFQISDVAADEFRVQGEGVRLLASGRMSEHVQVSATVDLEQLPIEGVKLGGSATADVKVWGTINEPLIEGRVSAENATVFSEGMNVPANIRAVADFNRNEVVINTLRAEWGSAIAQITGRSDIRGVGEFGSLPQKFLSSESTDVLLASARAASKFCIFE